jgi:hypothetical protein
MTKHISKMLEGVVGDYTLYKQTHDVIMNLPIIKTLQNKVYSLESQLKSHGNDGGQGGCVRDVPTRPPHQGSPPNNTPNDYDEVIQLKKLIENLTKHITHLETQVCGKQPQREDASDPAGQPHHHDHHIHNHNHNHDNCENGVRLEVHENENELQSETDESDDENISKLNHQNKIVHSTNVITEHQAEISDHDDDSRVDEEEENEEATCEYGKETTEDAVDEEDAGEEEEAGDEEEEAGEEEGDAVDEEEEDAVDEEEEEEDAGEEEDATEAKCVSKEKEEDTVEEEEEEEEVVEEEEEVAADEDEIEVSEIKIKGKVYFTTNPQNGIIYACVNDDVGDEVGVFKNGIALFNAKK